MLCMQGGGVRKETTPEASLLQKVRTFRDFPRPGILFRDIVTVVKDPKAFNHAVRKMMDHYRGKKIDLITGVESRGFIFGAAMAHRLGVGFVPIRKLGKLPGEVEKAEYSLEYSNAVLEIQKDAVKKGQRVLVVDDLLATGGTAKAAATLVERLGGKVVGICFFIELSDLHGRDELKGYDVFSLVEDRRK